MSIKITLKELKISWQYEEFWLNVEFSDEILYLRSTFVHLTIYSTNRKFSVSYILKRVFTVHVT